MKRFLPIFCMALSLLLASPALGAQDRDESEALRGVCAQAAACVLTPDMTDGEKALALHDWLALRCAYNPLDEASRDTAAGSLIKGLAVCRGYAAGYAYLTWSTGLSGLSTYSAQLDHAWVILALDGSRYFSDATWDDTRAPCIGRIQHTWFAFSDATAENLQHTGWDRTDIAVSGGAYERAPWLAAVTRVVFAGAYLYYMDDECRLIRCGRADWQTETLYDPDASWPLSTAEGFRAGAYTGLVYLDGRLWFNTPSAVVSVDLDGGSPRTEYVLPDGSDGQLYGLDVRDGELTVCLASDPKDDTYTLADTGISAADAWGY